MLWGVVEWSAHWDLLILNLPSCSLSKTTPSRRPYSWVWRKARIKHTVVPWPVNVPGTRKADVKHSLWDKPKYVEEYKVKPCFHWPLWLDLSGVCGDHWGLYPSTPCSSVISYASQVYVSGSLPVLLSGHTDNSSSTGYHAFCRLHLDLIHKYCCETQIQRSLVSWRFVMQRWASLPVWPLMPGSLSSSIMGALAETPFPAQPVPTKLVSLRALSVCRTWLKHISHDFIFR